MYLKETTMTAQCMFLRNNNACTMYVLKKQQWLHNVCFKETTMAEQYILKKQQWLNNVFLRNNNGWTMYFKETTMAGQYILKKQQWLNNIF